MYICENSMCVPQLVAWLFIVYLHVHADVNTSNPVYKLYWCFKFTMFLCSTAQSQKDDTVYLFIL